MGSPIQLISTDFDGTIHAEFENPPVPRELQVLIGDLQKRGVKWVINTGRDLSSLMEEMGRAHLAVKPDFLVTVEREIFVHEGARYVGLSEWNDACTEAHLKLFKQVHKDLPMLVKWVNERFPATVYEDAYSPFCLIAEDEHDASIIQEFLLSYCEKVPHLSVVRNDVYARFSHDAYNKGTALAKITKRLGLGPENVFAVGDHFNDLPMLSKDFAHWLAAPANAIEEVKEKVVWQDGYVSTQHCGYGVTRSLEFFLSK